MTRPNRHLLPRTITISQCLYNMAVVLCRVLLRRMQCTWQDLLCYHRRSVSAPPADPFEHGIEFRYPVSVDQTTNGLLDAPMSGIMGLAFQSIAFTRAVPFWQALVNNNLFAEPQISFWLTRYMNGSHEEPGGVMTLGGSNASLYTGEIQFLDMPSSVQPSYWLLQLSSE